MKTDALIAALAADTAPVAPGAAARRLGLAAGAGAALALILILAWLKPRSDLVAALATPAFWMKASYTLALSLAGGLLTARLARPGGRTGPGRWVLAGAVAVVAVLGAISLALAAPDQRAAAWLGHSWTLCPWRILVAAAPVFVALVLALRRLAPTRLALAGAAAGLLAGAIGATVYGLACNETSATFLAFWYTLGIAGCAAIGAVLGRWLLRW